MDPIRIEGTNPTQLPRAPYDLRRRQCASPLGLCHAPWVGLHLGADGGAAPCRHTAHRYGPFTPTRDGLTALWNGEAVAALRARFASYRVIRDECRGCVALWEDEHAGDSPAVAEFDGEALDPRATQAPRVLSIDATEGFDPAHIDAITPWLAGLQRLELTLDGPLAGSATAPLLAQRPAGTEVRLRFAGHVPDPDDVPDPVSAVTLVHPMLADHPGPRFLERLAALGASLKRRGVPLELEVPVNRDNWIHLGEWWRVAGACDADLLPELVAPNEPRSLAPLEANALACMHAVFHHWRKMGERVGAAERVREVGDRLLARARRWQRLAAVRDSGVADYALPALDHPLMQDDAACLDFLSHMLRLYHHRRIEDWLRELVSRPDFAERARGRRPLRFVLMWWISVFQHSEDVVLLREILGDPARAAELAGADRAATRDSAWQGWIDSWIQEFNLQPSAVRGPRFPAGERVPAVPGQEPRVTVIIPSYNHAAYVTSAIESVLAQTAPDFHLIVADDGSSDATVERARAVDDPRVRVIARPKNQGLGHNLALALAEARTPYVAVLNSDDLFHPQRLERCLALMQEHPGVHLVATGLTPVDDDGHERRADASSPVFDGKRVYDWLRWYEGQQDKDTSPEGLLGSLLEGNFLLSSSNLVGTREFFAAYEERWREQEFCLDWELLLMGAADRALVVLPEPLLGYRLHGGNTVWFDDDRQWRYYVESNQVIGRLLMHEFHRRPDGQERIDRFTGLLVEHLTRNTDMDGAGVLLGVLLDQLGMTARDLRSPAVQDRIRLLHETMRRRLEARDVFREFGQDVGALYRMRGEYDFLKKLRLAHEALSDAHARLQGELLGLLFDRANAEKLWHQAEADRDAEVAGKADLYQRIGEVEGERDAARREVQRLAEQHRKDEQRIFDATSALSERTAERDSYRDQIKVVRQEVADRLAALSTELTQRTAERDQALRSAEFRLGRLLLDKLHLRMPLRVGEKAWMRGQHGLVRARMKAGGRTSRAPYKALATACWNFPIYSQTFVYQELVQLMNAGFDLRFVYSKLDPRSYLHDQFERLWGVKRKLVLHRDLNRADMLRYEARMPDRVAALRRTLCDASGMSEEDLRSHDSFQQAFSFTRLVEDFGPDYLHSYFFYDRTLMTLVAANLLDLPRGVSCYADHLMNDYELKVVPLHLRQCDIVIATSARIKDELIGLEPAVDPDRILVKPNAIDSEQFPVMERQDPPPGEPFRLVCVNRIEPKKGLTYLVEAVRRLKESGFPVELHLCGEADQGMQASQDYHQALVEQIGRSDLWGTVHLEGRQNQQGVQRFLGISQLFLAPFVETETGDKDGIPTALLEAMATGIPALATDAGSILEVIDADQDGVIVPMRDPEALATAIRALCEDPARRAALGRAGADKIRRRFDVKVCETAFHERVRAILQARRASR